MYQIVKAKFAAKNPASNNHSLLESFYCLIDITNTDNEDYVWQIINECDLDFNLAAERLLSRPPPARGTPSFSARPFSGGSAANAAGPVLSPVSMPSPLGSKQQTNSPSSSIFQHPLLHTKAPAPAPASSPKKPCTDFLSPATARSATSSAIAQTARPFHAATFSMLETEKKSSPAAILQAQALHKALTSKAQAGGISSPQELACLQFNMICDSVSGARSDSGVLHELNKLGAFSDLQQLALSGQLWSFVPITRLDFFGVEISTIFSNSTFNPVTQRGSKLNHYIKLNSYGLSLKFEFQPSALDEASISTELLLPFSCFTLQSFAFPVLTLNINAPSDVRTDFAFSTLFNWKGKGKGQPSPPISRISIFCNDSREPVSLEKDIIALKNGKSPHALDLSRMSTPLPKLNEGLAKNCNFHMFCDPFHLAMVLFDESLLLELKAENPYALPSPSRDVADIKFVLSFKFPSFLLPVMMRAKAKMQLVTWSRDRPLVSKLFDRLIKVRIVAPRPLPPHDSAIIPFSLSPPPHRLIWSQKFFRSW
jgi:hypothetical protein